MNTPSSLEHEESAASSTAIACSTGCDSSVLLLEEDRGQFQDGQEECGVAEVGGEAEAREHVTDSQLGKARMRRAWLQAIRECLAAGFSCKQAVAEYPQHSGPTLTRLRQIAEAQLPGGSSHLEQVDWLLAQPLDVLTPGVSTGRKPAHVLTDNEALALRGLILARSTQNDHSPANHFALAIEEFVQLEQCTPATRCEILARLDEAARFGKRAVWPKSWRRQAYPNRNEVAKFRGRKHAAAETIRQRRGMFWVDVGGEERPCLPHTIWELDDASSNEPFASVDADTGEKILSRQVLWVQDLYSASLLGFTQVARPRDAYRIEDVADHILNTVRAFGLPTFLRLENGKIWNGSLFHGIPVRAAGWSKDERWGGLDGIMGIENVCEPWRKGGMEGSFNLTQGMAAHAGQSIGRKRGEFEHATKALVRAHLTGEVDPRFWDMARAANHMEAVCARFNSRAKERRAFGNRMVVPDDLLKGAKGTPLPADQWWRFCPVKRVGIVRGGHLDLSDVNYPKSFRFRVNGEADGIHFENGYALLAAFHPGRPHEGCHVFNAEVGPRNRDNFKKGEFLFVAPFAADVPQIDLSGKADFSPARKANAAVNSMYRAIGQEMRVSVTQNSNGTARRLEEGMPPAPVPPPSTATAPTLPEPGPATAAAQPAPRRARPENPFRCADQADWEAQCASLERLARATESDIETAITAAEE